MPIDLEVWRERLRERDPAAGRVALEAARDDAEALAALADDLAACGLTAAWASLAEATGEPALIEAFERLWHEGDDEVAAAWARLASAAERDVPEEVARGAARHDQRLRLRDRARTAAADSPKVARWLAKPVVLRVRCEACGRDAPHEAPTVFFDPERHGADPSDGILAPMVLGCPFCGAEDDFSITETSAIEVATRGLAAARLEGPWAVQLGRASLEDGTPIRRASDGLRILRERAEASADDPAAWRRLGNYAIRCDRIDDALDAWRRGAAIPEDFDCALAVAMEAVARGGEDAAAFDDVARAVARLSNADPQRRPIQAAQLAEAIRRIRGDDPLTLSLGDLELDVHAIGDWSRLGELLASTKLRAASLERRRPSGPVTLADAFARVGR